MNLYVLCLCGMQGFFCSRLRFYFILIGTVLLSSLIGQGQIPAGTYKKRNECYTRKRAKKINA